MTNSSTPESHGNLMDDRPKTEVEQKAKRRRFTATYKRQIVKEAATSTERGAIGALLRREGLYSSQLQKWRKEVASGDLSNKKRGRKKKDPAIAEAEKLRKENARLKKQLHQAELIIEVQKKVSALLGVGTTEED